MAKKTPVMIHLDADFKAWLDAEAARRRCSMSQILRELILAEMERRTQ